MFPVHLLKYELCCIKYFFKRVITITFSNIITLSIICVIGFDPDEEDNTTPFFQQQLKAIKGPRYVKYF